MNLYFDSLEEFREMAEAMGYVRASEYVQHVSVGVTRSLADGSEWAQAEAEQGNEPAPAGEPSTAGVTTGSTESAAATAASEKPKRTRRTKAQIAADNAAADSSVLEPSSSNADDASTQSTNPFDASASNPSAATQAILNAPTGQAATLAGIAAMQANPFDPASAQSPSGSVAQTAPETAATSATDAASYIEARSLELLTSGDPITPVSHMHKCREFIGKHGQAKYVETFPLATLPMTVATFKPDQCARHQAAMEFAAQSNI